MSAMQILNGLETLTLTGEDAESAARLGFLEWVFSQAVDATPDGAAKALDDLGDDPAQSDAGLAFVGYLQQATEPVARSRARLGRARRFH